MTVLALVALVAWASVLLVPWQPYRARERLEAAGRRPGLAHVTVLIPARNEAASIEQTLAALCRQGPGLEVIVIDDESDDGTRARCEAFRAAAASAAMHELAAGGAGPGADGPHAIALRIIAGRPRPPGWSGKLWALEQGLAEVRRSRVLLLDADIELAPGMIATLDEQARRSGADLVSIMATLRCTTLVEKLLAPPFVFFFKLIYPFALAGDARSRVAAAAGGCMLVSADALQRIGGFGSLHGALIDDCTLAATLKRSGHRIWIGLSRSVKSTRGYSFADFWRMVKRTAFTQLRYSPAWLAGTTAAMLIVFVVPYVALVAASSPLAVGAGAAAIAAMLFAYLPLVRFYGLPAAWVLTLPAAAVLFLAMTWDSAFGFWRGVRAEWKGRAYGAQR